MECVKPSGEDGKKYKLVAPDGGWGYMICISATLAYTIGTCFASCFGMIFKDFLEEHNLGSTELTILNSVYTATFAISGFLTAPLLGILSQRNLAFIAAALFNLGTVGQIFINSFVTLFVCQSIFQGFGFGLFYTISSTVLNEYFVERRLLAISFAQTIAGVSSMGAPLLVQWFHVHYGFRGTLILIAGISVNLFLSAALLKPIENHMKRVEVTEETPEEMELLKHSDKENKSSKEPPPKSFTLSQNEKAIPEIKVEETEVSRFRKLLKSFKEMLQLKSYFFSSGCLGMVMVVLVEFNYILMLPQALYSRGLSHYNVSLALALYNLGDLLTKISLFFSNNLFKRVGSNKVYIFGIFVGAVTRCGVQLSSHVIMVQVFLTLMGISKCIIAVLMPLVVADSVTEKQFPAALGLVMLLMAVMGLPFGPICGTIRDMTNSYSIVYYIFSLISIVIATIWCIEILYKNRKIKQESIKTLKR